MSVEADNNLISGGRPYLIEDAGHGSVAGTRNWMPTGTSPGALSETVFGSSPFADPAARDFTLAPDSTAIGSASQEVSGLPDREYYQSETVTRMYRIRETELDIGAFESSTSGPGIGPYDTARAGP